MRFLPVAALAALAASCASAVAGEALDGPYVLVLGTAQDGGLPQIGCVDPPCREARDDPCRRRLVASILLVDPRTGKRFLFDASPDLPEQVEASAGHPPGRVAEGPRPALFDGVFLTHAHMGHYTGLLHLGPEAYGARALPVFTSERMGSFLSENGPWSLLVETGVLDLRTVAPGSPVWLGEDLCVTALAVPHREEFSDTLAFVIEGPRRSLLYLPDIDKWERWSRPVEDVLREVDVALVDGTFFDGDELPERNMDEIPHPFVAESIDRFAVLPRGERSRVVFTHLNHSNPLADPASPQSKRLRATGMSVARRGQVFSLGTQAR